MFRPDEQMLKLYRFSLEGFVGVAETSLASAERFCLQQQKAIKEAMAASAEMRKVIESAKDFDALREIQTSLASTQLGRVASYWNGMYEVASMSYVEAMKQLQTRVAQVSDELRELTTTGQSAAEPAVTAWQSMVNAASNAYATTAKAAEEAARMAATQAENASAAARGKAPHSVHKAA
jgi:phasin family protein